MSNKKIVDKLIYGFMTLLILINSLTPLTSLAEEAAQPAMKLGEVSKGQAENLLDLKISATKGEETSQINVSQAVIEQATLEQNGQTKDLEVENNQVIDLPNDTDGAGIIHLTLKQEALKNLQQLDFSYQTQKVTYQFPQTEATESSSSSSIESTQTSSEESSSTSTNSSTSSVSTNTTSSSSESTESSQSSETSANKDNKAARADDPTDIRTYFPGGSGTILTGSNLVYYDDNGNIIEPPVPANTHVRIYYSWSIPEDVRAQIKPGDYFDFQLPEELRPTKPISGELKNADGEVYATYTVDQDGNVRFTFTDEVEKQSDINGSFYFDAQFKQDHIDGPGDITIHYPVEDNLPPVDVEIRPDTDTSIDKQGHFDRTPNPNSVEWTVDINQSMEHLTDPKVTENWPKGIDYKSVKVYELVMNLDGTVKEVGRELSPDEYTVDANGNVTVKGDTNKAYRLVYQTDIEDSAKPENGGKVSFTNTASLSDKNDPDGIDAKATVTSNYGKPVEKNMTGYDPNNQVFNWEIKYNYGEKNISKDDATITDTISKNMDLVDGSVKIYPITFDAQGNETKGAPLVEGKDYELVPNPDGHGFQVKFLHDIDGAVKVEYQTKVNGIVTDPTQVNNSVSTGTGDTGGDSGTAQQQNVIKKLTDVDYSDHKAGWEININKNHYYMENLELTDTYSPTPGLTMSKNSDGSFDFQIRDVTSNKTLVQGKDYTLELTKNAEGQETGFKVVFLGDYNPTSSEFVIDYHTDFDVSLLDPNNPDKDRFKNNMAADWKDKDGNDHHSDGSQDFKPNDPYQLNAQKSGQYNAQTKEITWTIAVNLSGNTLTSAQLIDKIIKNQDYVSGSVKIYEAEVKKDGTVVKKQPETVVNDDMKKIDEPSDKNDQTLTVDFPEGVKTTYMIEFKTSVDGKIIEGSNQYDNVAQYENDKDERDVTGEVSIKNGGKYVQKSGEQDSKNPDYVNWKAVINPSQSTLSDVVIKDEPTENQVIDQDSIKLYETTVAQDGTITPNYDKPLTLNQDYTVAITTDNVTGKQELTIKMLHKIDTAYQLEYRSYITSSASGNKDTVSNQINVTGDNEQTVSGGDGQDVTVEIDHSGGSATGKKGSITIQKTEADGKTKLTGAKFQLWNTTKTQMLREGEVDSNGQITFGSLPYGEYLLFETQAPDGFTISDDLVAGRRITIDEKTSTENAAPLTIPNDRNKVILQKTDADGNPIKIGNGVSEGARFKLERLNPLAPNGSLWDPVALNPDRTNSDGILEMDSLPLGFYRITEIEAPTGYMINETPTYFLVYRNSDHQIPTHYLNYHNYQGSAQLIKKDSEGNPLAGAEFDVLDKDGKKVNQQPLVSQADGKVTVTGLAPGDYKFVETKAPDGFIINSKEIPFTIDETSHDKPDMVTTQPDGSPLELANYQGSAEFVKKDKSGAPLAGAEFDLYKDNKKVNDAPITSDKDGKVRIDHLAPGKYTLRETKAPDGFLINTKEITFTVDASHNGELPVIELSDFINYKGAFQIIKRNTDGEGLEGAEFTLYKEDKTEVVQKVESGKDGKVIFKDLEPGFYYYKETKAPTVKEGPDYVINPALIKVVIPDEADGDPGIQELGDFQNFRGKAQITKVGDGGSIAGATFELYHIVNGEQDPIRTIVAPEDGILDISDLGAGSYKLVETKAAPGYIINDQAIYFVVQENDDQNPNIDNLDFDNYQVEVIGHKLAKDKTPLAGAEYQVFEADEHNQPIGDPVKVTDRDGNSTDTIKTDKDGEIYFKGIDLDGEKHKKFVLIEKVAPDGYVRDTSPHPFEITEQTGKPKPIELGNFINYQGSISLVKKNDEGKVLKGAEFEIHDKDGKVQTVINQKGNKTETLVSDKNGKISATGLAPGEYKLFETKAPDNYLINDTPIPFEVADQAAGEPEKIILPDFINYQGSVRMKKVSDHGKPLAGAVFELHQGKKSIGKYTANKDGLVSIDHLAPGKYTLTEIKAPNGYLINTKEISFEITDEPSDKAQLINLKSFVNYQGSVKLEKVSTTGKSLAGAVFGLYNADGKQINDYTSNKNGQISVKDLSPGDYYFMEKEAPIGYTISKEKRKFTISSAEENKPSTVDVGEFVNKESSKTPNSSESPSKRSSSNHTSGTTTGSYPKTNDTRNPWLLIAGAVIIIIAGTIYYRRRKG